MISLNLSACSLSVSICVENNYYCFKQLQLSVRAFEQGRACSNTITFSGINGAIIFLKYLFVLVQLSITLWLICIYHMLAWKTLHSYFLDLLKKKNLQLTRENALLREYFYKKQSVSLVVTCLHRISFSSATFFPFNVV